MIAFLTLLLMVQAPQPAESKPSERDPLGPVRPLVGEWRGEGWVEFMPGNRRVSSVTETVWSKAGGDVLVVEGLGKAADPASGKEITVHEAFAVIWYDAPSRRIMFHAFKAGGISHQTALEVLPEGIRWQLPGQRGMQVRFTVTMNESKQWHEIGEVSRDGQSWTQFLEMTLTRTASEK